MLKKLLILLCLGAFIAVATIGGCGQAEDEEPAKNGEEEKGETPEPE